jgi:hypothetical protein
VPDGTLADMLEVRASWLRVRSLADAWATGLD